jgi:hypothetical protein
MKNELEHIINNYFSGNNNQILYANLDIEAAKFCKTFDELLNIMVSFDHPDFYAKKNNTVYIFEHFMIDSSEVKIKGSLERKETSRIKKRVEEYFTEDKKGHISDRIDNKANFENFKKNLYSNYNKHLVKIPKYKVSLKNKEIIDEKSDVITSFFIENTSIMGNYLYVEEKLKPFIPFTADFYIKMLEGNRERPDFIIYTQKTKNEPIVAIMSTKLLDVYKQNSMLIENNTFIAFSPHTVQKRFFIEGPNE